MRTPGPTTRPSWRTTPPTTRSESGRRQPRHKVVAVNGHPGLSPHVPTSIGQHRICWGRTVVVLAPPVWFDTMRPAHHAPPSCFSAPERFREFAYARPPTGLSATAATPRTTGTHSVPGAPLTMLCRRLERARFPSKPSSGRQAAPPARRRDPSIGTASRSATDRSRRTPRLSKCRNAWRPPPRRVRAIRSMLLPWESETMAVERLSRPPCSLTPGCRTHGTRAPPQRRLRLRWPARGDVDASRTAHRRRGVEATIAFGSDGTRPDVTVGSRWPTYDVTEEPADLRAAPTPIDDQPALASCPLTLGPGTDNRRGHNCFRPAHRQPCRAHR